MPPAAPPTTTSGTGIQTDNTKAIAVPIFGILALVLAIFFTRHSLSAALESSKGDFKKMILFFGGCTCSLASVFLLATPAYEFALGNLVFAQASSLLCSPGILEIKAEAVFTTYLAWFMIMIGIPDLWSDGILGQLTTAACKDYFPHKSDTMCKEGWLTFSILLALAIIIVNFFCVVALMSIVFQDSAESAPYQQIPDNNAGGSTSAAVSSSPGDAHKNFHPQGSGYRAE